MSLLTQFGDIRPSIGLGRQVGQLFFPREYKLLTEESEIRIDTVLSEIHNSSLSLTKFAVEQGADMSDHYVVNPIIFNLVGVISDISSNEFIDFALTGLAKKAVDSVIGLLGDGADTEESGTKSQLAWKQLKALQQSGEFITYNSNLEVYENMLITNLSVKQNSETSRAITFDMTLEQVLIADLEIVKGQGIFSSLDPSKGNPSTKDKMGDATQKGKKIGTSVPKESSALFKLFGGS